MNRPVLWNKFTLKRRFILLLFILLLTAGWYYLAKNHPWDIIIPAAPIRKTLPDYVFQQVMLREVSGTKIFYQVSASSLTLDSAQGQLEQVRGSIMDNNNTVFNFTAQNGVLNIAKKLFTLQNFSGQTNTRYYQPWHITAPLAYWDNTLQNFTFDRKPKLTSRDLNISASKIVYNSVFNFFMFGAGCEIQKGEYTIKSDRAVLRNAVDILTLEDNVALQSNDFTGRADALDWDIRRDELNLKNNVILQTSDIILTGDQVSLNTAQETVLLKNNVRLQNKENNGTDNIIVNTDRALWLRQAGKIQFFENTQAWKNNSLIQSNQIVYDFTQKDIVASGGGRTTIITTDE
jgi:lipopolysaccharide export system protein LptA